MKKLILIAAAFAALASCKSLKEEFQPVFTSKYDNPPVQQPVQMESNITVAQLVSTYKTGKPYVMNQGYILKGQVVTTDQPGNFYKSFYIQDETGGIELKIGKNGLYNDYLPGQWIYVSCDGLTLGMYGYKDGNYGGNGMVQIGFEDTTGSYETSYLETSILIDRHIFKGEKADLVQPAVITEDQLPGKKDTQKNNKYIGSLVTLKGLKYANEIFALLYIDSNKDTKLSSNRIFLSDGTWGVTTYAMSKSKMTEYLLSGIWDKAKIGNSGDQSGLTVGDFRGDGTYPGISKSAYSVSQYFKMGGTEIQLRTSGYCKFSDLEIPESVLNGKATIDVTGILTLYQGSIQFIVNSKDDIVVNE